MMMKTSNWLLLINLKIKKEKLKNKIKQIISRILTNNNLKKEELTILEI